MTLNQTPALPDDLIIPGGLPPEDMDPLKDGILMAHQLSWIEDKSDLKACEKGRRTGITFAECLDDTLIAAAARSAGGDHVWYIGDTKEKGLEFIQVAAHFARTVAQELLKVEEFLFDDIQPDGSSRTITSYRIRFASGFQIAALSSRPANIRGLQGIVVIDEAAFHNDVRAVIDACLALLIWGGKVRIISTHNGVMNAFNELIKDARAGKNSFNIHRYTFDDAVKNGLYERRCLIKQEEPTEEGKQEWYAKILASYGTREDARQEELFAVPREGDGTVLTLSIIEACQDKAYSVKRWEAPLPVNGRSFVDWPERDRHAHMLDWLDREVGPILATFPKNLLCAMGGDFAMRQDVADYAFGYTAKNLDRIVPLIIEMRQCPYDCQKLALFYACDRLARFQGGILDANGNGMALAQEARQKYGPETIVELMPSDNWNRENWPLFQAAFEDREIRIPADDDIRDDLRQFRSMRGVVKIPSNIRTEGTNGGKRHGDAGVALFNFHAASRSNYVPSEYEPIGIERIGSSMASF